MSDYTEGSTHKKKWLPQQIQRYEMEGVDKMTLSDDRKKRLTMFLGECSEHDWIPDPFPLHTYSCNNCCAREIRPLSCGDSSRTFTTWQDLGDLKEKLEEKGMWEQCNAFMYKAFARQHATAYLFQDHLHLFTAWLINPATFIPLVAEYLEVNDARSKGNP